MADACRPRHPVGQALLRNMSCPFGWVDAFVLMTALRNRDGPYHASYRLAVDSLRSLAAVMLAGDVSEVLAAFQAVIVADDARAVHIIVSTLACCVKGVECLINFVRVVRGLMQACPRAAVGLVEELVESCADVLIGVLDVLPRSALRVAGECCVARVRVAVVESEGGWGRLFIGLRKGLLFGDEAERCRVLELGREVVRGGGYAVAKEAVEVLDASIGEDLADVLAVGMAEILGVAVMRGILRGEPANMLLQRRVEKRCPGGLVRRRSDDEKSQQSEALQVDVGLVWNQSPSAVSFVISSAIALKLVSDSASNEESMARALLDVLVLVPVVCIPLYQAVEDCNRDFEILPTGTTRRSRIGMPLRRIGGRGFPQALSQTSIRDLARAISSFGAGMSAIVGILNLSCMSLKLCQRIMSVHGRSRNLVGYDKDVVWTLLERLTEFDRMLNALLLGHEVLQAKISERDNSSEQDSSLAKGEQQAQKSALVNAEIMKEAVVRSVFAVDGSSDQNRVTRTNVEENVPRFSLQSIVCSLIAVPDEAGIESLCDTSLCKQSRDIELARIDKMLLRHLFCVLNPSKTVDNTQQTPRPQLPQTESLWDSTNFLDAWDLKKAEKEVAALAKNADCLDLDSTDNVFFLPEDEMAPDEEFTGNVSAGAESNRWAPYEGETVAANSEYMRSAMSLLAKQECNVSSHGSEVASVIHSPAFAALLLDRAATYAAVARRARQLSAEGHYLSTAVTVAGFALGCLIAVLRIIPFKSFLISDIRATVSGKSNSACERVLKFLQAMDEKLLVGVPESQMRHLPDIPLTCGAKTISTLLWISQTSIDVTVATLGLDALLTISEFGCLRLDFSRKAVLSSLTTIYEYDSCSLWARDDRKRLLDNPFSAWSLRRRQGRRGSKWDVSSRQDLTSDQEPWVALRAKGLRKARGIERHRLNLLFSGMHVPKALLEASGWIREVSLIVVESSAQSDGLQESADLPLHARTSREATDRLPPRKRHNTSKCETLLDMIGFRNLMETLLQLVHHALESYRLSDKFSVDDALHVRTNPVMHIQTALKLFCSILRVYHRARQAVFREPARELNLQLDGELDHVVLSLSLPILQLTRARIDNIRAWYSNPVTDVSRLSDETVECLERIIGCAMVGVRQCTEICDALKRQYASLTAPETPVNTQASVTTLKRKSPGFAKSRRRKSASGGEGVSKARRLVPRLSAQCEAVTKETQKLAKVMGLKIKRALFKYAPTLPDEELELGFGAGLDLEERVGVDGDEEIQKGAEENCVDADFVDVVETDMNEDEFLAKAQRNGSSTAEPETIKVKFNT